MINLEDIFPINEPDKKEYLIDITNKISKFVLDYYKDKLDPSTSYSHDGINIYFNSRKNSCIGVCRRIPRIINYNETKIKNLEYWKLIELASHECTHLIYDGHDEKFTETHEFIFTICINRLKQHNTEFNR